MIRISGLSTCAPSAIAPLRVATGEHMANRVVAEQFLQAEALSELQLDATRVAGAGRP